MEELDFDYRRFTEGIPASDAVKGHFYAELMAGGFTHADGTVEFYTRINALLRREFHVLDFGAGRASWVQTDRSSYRRKLRNLQHKAASVTACDVDDAVLLNPVSDRQVLCTLGAVLPFENESFDFIVADWVFEHVNNPELLSKELTRILKPGGWICARTPNRFGYIALATRLISNRYHSLVLKYVQPERLEKDIFPTTFLINSMNQVKRHFPDSLFDNHSYYNTAEPGYFFNKYYVFRLMKILNYLTPSFFSPNLHIFLRKK